MTPDMKRLYEAAVEAFSINCQYDDSPYGALPYVVEAVLEALPGVSEGMLDKIDFEVAFHNPNECVGRGVVRGVFEEAANLILAGRE